MGQFPLRHMVWFPKVSRRRRRECDDIDFSPARSVSNEFSWGRVQPSAALPARAGTNADADRAWVYCSAISSTLEPLCNLMATSLAWLRRSSLLGQAYSVKPPRTLSCFILARTARTPPNNRRKFAGNASKTASHWRSTGKLELTQESRFSTRCAFRPDDSATLRPACA